MNKTPSPTRCAALLSAALLLGSLGVETRADYASTVAGLGPIAYYRLNETASVPAANIAVNRGSLGSLANGSYVGGATHPTPGALVGSPNTAASFPNVSGNRVRVAYDPSFALSGPLTVEFWANPNDVAGVDSPTMCPLGFTQFDEPPGGGNGYRSGWLFYQNAGTGWTFRLYGTGNTAYSATVNQTVTPGTWYHVVGVYDGTQVMIYVDGQLKATVAAPLPHEPVINPMIPLGIGARSDGHRGFFSYNGSVDEVAVYPGALASNVILSHYQNGIAASPSQPYDQLILAGNPICYYRLDEPDYYPPDPATLPIAANTGSAGNVADGIYQPGVETAADGPPFSGFGANNSACFLDGVNGYVSLGYPDELNFAGEITMIAWIKPTQTDGLRDIVAHGYTQTVANQEIFFRINAGDYQVGSWESGSTTTAGAPAVNDIGKWVFLVGTYDGAKWNIYHNGDLIASTAVANSGAAVFLDTLVPWSIGSRGDPTLGDGRFFRGAIDEVAIFDKALTVQQIQDIYLSANVPPWITQQPVAPGRDIYAGNIVTLSVAAGGNPPLSYQWRKDGADLPGQTSTSLVFNSITEADAGAYTVVVSNPFGSVTSNPVTLTVKPAETAAPTLLYAAGNETWNGVRVWFSEPLDPASAQTASNYQLSGGLTISSATLAAPAGTPGDNIVDLVTSAQNVGQVYTLTVSNVKDQVAPANTIAEGSTVLFTSCILSPGLLQFELWSGLSTTDNSIANTLLRDPRFPDAPTTDTFTSACSTTPVFGADTSREGYGGKMSGLLVPTTTGDYRFFLYSDDSSRLYLSTDADPANKVLVAEEVGCCVAFMEPDPLNANWHDNGSGMGQTTLTPIHLVAGKQYYIEAIWKEGTGGDYCHVAWREEQDSTPASELPSIESKYLTAVVDPNIDFGFVTQPTDQIGVPATSSVEIFSANFDSDDGGFTVVNEGQNATNPIDPPGPWYWLGGVWSADGAESACTGPYNSQLISPTNTITQAGAVILTFSHRYSFETPLWDAGQVRISVNGGAFTLVPAENFLANGYADGAIIGNGIALGQRGFNGNSDGHASGAYITSQALLGTFNVGDRVVVQFVGAWDDCTTASLPGWEIDSMKIEVMVGAAPSTFTAEAEALRREDALEVRYQWQRNDGAGWKDIPNATGTSYQITPLQVDMLASFRVMATVYGVPGMVIYSEVVKLTVPKPTLAIERSPTGITVTFTGSLQSSTSIMGAFNPVAGATSPYTVPDPTGTLFFRAVKQ